MPPAQNYMTGLILLSATTDSGAEEALRAVLEPFTLEILEVQKIELRGRLICGFLIAFDPAHAHAISDDINQFSHDTGIDAALDYSEIAAE